MHLNSEWLDSKYLSCFSCDTFSTITLGLFMRLMYHCSTFINRSEYFQLFFFFHAQGTIHSTTAAEIDK